MLTIYSDKHKLRNSKTELVGGLLVEPFERPSRMEHITARIKETGLGEMIEPRDFGMDPILAIHDADFVSFLSTAWEEWKATGAKGEAIACTWPARRMVQICPNDINGKLGYYCLATETSISEGTWEATLASANVALEGADRLADEKVLFSACRPPGHHAAIDLYGGYCFLNNAGIAAQYLLDKGTERIAILDVDYHHGNGTQDIFYTRDDVLFISLHCDPMDEFPNFLGYANETGEGAGEGYNLNFPMKPGTKFDEWRANLKQALDRISDYAPDALIVSLGVDTFKNDPISQFKLESDDFTTYGADIAKLGLPTLFVMEGGYDIGEIGLNTVNVLQGFEAG